MNTPNSSSQPTPAGPPRADGSPDLASRQPPVASAPLHVILHPSSGSGRRWPVWIGWIGFLVTLVILLRQWSARHDYYDVTGGIRERYHSGHKYSSDKVAVITLRGVIMEGDGFIKRQIDRVREDKNVKAVVLRIESPGGTVTGSDYILHHLQKLRQERELPLVVSMGSIATSGGYYAAMAVGDQERSIFAEPTTTTGSIGVIVPHYDISGVLAKYDVQNDSVVSHPRKQLLSMTRPMSAEDREIIQQYVDDSFARFKSIVKQGRPKLRQANADDGLVDVTTGRDLATGEIFPAPRALQYGLIDEIGFIEEAIERVSQLAGLDIDKVRVVEYERPASLTNLLGLAEAARDQEPLHAILELSAPQAYYLFTSLPPLVTSRGP